MSTATLDTTTVRRWKRYPEYRPSGADWLPQVPGHWEVRTAQRIGRLLKGGGGNKADAVSEGVPCVRYGELYTTHGYSITACKTFVTPERAIDYTPIHYGDVLFAASGETLEEIGKSAVNLMQSSACCGGDLVILRPTIPTHAPFLGYAMDCELAAAQKASMGRGTTVKHIYPDELKHLAVALPPLPEQRAIAAFLDRETARIDALIGHKERLIALLEEKRQAVISHAVTRGLDPAAKLKDSGIPWLGMVPEHWTIKKLKYSVRFLNYRRIPLSAEERGGLEKIYPYYGASGIIDHVDRYIFDEPLILIGEDGANLLSRSSPLAFIATGKYWVNNHAHILKPASGQLLYWTERLNSISYVPFVSGSAQPKLTIESLGSIAFAAPEPDEQAKIAAFISDQDTKIAPIIARIRDGIARLHEYRTALISAAVTGQIDVRSEV